MLGQKVIVRGSTPLLHPDERVIAFLQWNPEDHSFSFSYGQYGIFNIRDGKVEPVTEIVADHNHGFFPAPATSFRTVIEQEVAKRR